MKTVGAKENMSTSNFFDESSEQSQVKSEIVRKYFNAWAKVIIGAQGKYRPGADNRTAYIDLFAGPGRYRDGTVSTPLMILENAIQDDKMRNRLVTIFNDKDENNTDSLQEAIDNLPNVNMLAHAPQVRTQEIGLGIVEMFESMRLVPTLFFVDPWGYKGLSLRLVNSVVKNWGCDCIFFFNYNRINMGLNNTAVKDHMDALFEEERANRLRIKLNSLPPERRELAIVEELCQALRDLGPSYVLPFRFKDIRGTRTSHHLIFVSKAFKGYEIMKDIMAKESSSTVQGVASFEYNVVDSQLRAYQPLLFQLSQPIELLGDMLLQEFAGQSLKMIDIYQRHNVDRPYIKSNYKHALIKLEEEKKIESSPHRQGTFGDQVIATFP